MVRIIRAVLGLQAESGEVAVISAVLAAFDVQCAGSIKLDGRLVSQHFHIASGLFMPGTGRCAHRLTLAENEVVVISAGRNHLGTAFINFQAFADQQAVPQVQGGSDYRHIVSRRNQSLVHLGDNVRVNGDFMIFHRAVLVAAQVEIGMVRQVAQGGLVRGGFIPDDQVAHIVPGVGDCHVQVSGIVLLAVRGNPVEGNRILMLALFGRTGPEMGGKSHVAAVEMVHAVIIQRHLVFLAVNGEPAGADPVSVTPDGIAKAAVRSQIGFQGIKAECHVIHVSARVRDNNGSQDRAPLHHCHRSAHGIGHGKLMNILAFG